jgi:hypothetical protein
MDAITDFTSRLNASIVAAERRIELARRAVAAAEGELTGLLEAREQFALTKDVVDAIKRREQDEMDRIMFDSMKG